MTSPTQKNNPNPASPSAETALEIGQPGAADSPCVAVCSTLFDDICRGCGRTVMEVANWVFMDDAEKQAVWVRIRAEGYPRRPGTT
jgi:predicted Fe-S protein YdhL (DUF1289 family)